MLLEDLRKQSQQSLIDFLTTDLDLSRTYLQTARLAKEQEHHEALLDKVRHSVETVRTLLGRVQDRATWTAIHAKADAVEAELRGVPPWGSENSRDSN